jgi:MFS family permease
MYSALLNPLFLFMIICMFGTAITELFTNQWVNVLLSNITDNAILILMLTTGVMVIGRGFAGPIVHRITPTGVLLVSAILASLGLYIMATSSGNTLFAGALIFGVGCCYFWPCMLGFVSENLPRTGAVGLNLMGGAGMFAVSVYTIFMGGFYDNLVIKNLPKGSTLDEYRSAAPGTELSNLYNVANATAGPEVLKATLVIPVVLIVAFAGLFFYMRNKKKPGMHPAVAA